MNNYPDDWNIKTLDEVCSRIWIGLVTTMTKFYVKKGVKLIRNSDIRENNIDVKNLIQNLKKRNIGVLITDHNVKSTLEIVDRAYIIFEGKVLFKGKPDEIIKNKNVRTFYLGNDF